MAASAWIDPFPLNGNGGKVNNVVNQNTTTVQTFTISPGSTGSVFLLEGDGHARTYTLPAPSTALKGFNARFIVTTATGVANADVIQSATAATMQGVSWHCAGGTTGTSVAILNADSVAFAGTGSLGSYMDVFCDGTNYQCTSRSFNAMTIVT